MPREKFFAMSPQFGRSGLGLENMDALLERPGVYRSGTIQMGERLPRGLPIFPEPPILTFVRKDGPPPDDIECFGPWWAVSDRFKLFAEEIDPDAFQFGACNNSKLVIDGVGATYWLCAARRIGSFIDETKSIGLMVRTDGGRKQFVVLPPRTKLAVHRDKLGTGHAFGVPEMLDVFCDEHFRSQFKAAQLRLRSFEAV